MASKKKKNRSTPGFPWVGLYFANFFRSYSKFFSALEIKDKDGEF